MIILLQFDPVQYKNYFAEQYSEDMTLYGSVDLTTRSDGTMEITGEDPYIIYVVPEAEKYLNAKVSFIGSLEIPLSLHVYYADEVSNFSEENTIDVLTGAADNFAIIPLLDCSEKISYLRIDYENTLDYVPVISSVQLQNDTLISRAASILLWLWNGHLLITLLISSILVALLTYFLGRKRENDYRNDLIAIGIMAVSFLIIYYDYILGEKTFFFYDEIGSDSFILQYPGLISTANRISNGLWEEYVNFTRGLGNRVSALNLNIGNFFCLFGESAIARWTGIAYYLYVLLAGVLAFYWAKIYSGNIDISLMVAFGYAMSSEFTIRSAWSLYPHLALVLIFWLMAFELGHRKGKWYLLPFATMIFFYNINIFFCVFWGFLLIVYIFFRVLAERADKISWKELLKAELLYCSFAAIGMADKVISQLEKTLTSTRFTSAVSRYSHYFDTLFSNRTVIFSAFLRSIGQTINGISEDFSGDDSFLCDPAFYCGILFLLLIPMAIYNSCKQKKVLWALALVAVFIYIFVVPVRVVANGFSDSEFRHSSFWICILMLILSMDILKQIIVGGGLNHLKKGSLEMFQASTVLAITMLLFAARFQYIVRVQELMISIFFMVVYGIIMQHLVWIEDKQILLVRILSLVVAGETLAVSWSTVNDRNVIQIEDLQQKKYYNDYTVNSVDAIREMDGDWYRIDKSYGSVGLADSIVQGYYGVSSYIGGLEADAGIIAIYKALELTRTNQGYHCLMGTGGNIYASSLLGIKYYLSKSEVTDCYGLQYLTKVGDVYIYENKLALPIAYTYSEAIAEEDFDQLSVYGKSQNILKGCVVSRENEEIEMINPRQVGVTELSEFQRFYERSGQFCDVDIDENQVLVMRMNMLKSGYFQTIYYVDKNGAVCGESITYGPGEKIVEVYCDDLASIVFSEQMCKDMGSIEYYVVDAQQYYENLKYNVAKLQNNAMEIVYHDDIYNYIEGAISCNSPCVLATSIPMRNEWKILVNGEETETITVNKGFLGCYLDEGEHDIVIYYDGKSWFEANIFKIFGFIVAAGILLLNILSSIMSMRKKEGLMMESTEK